MNWQEMRDKMMGLLGSKETQSLMAPPSDMQRMAAEQVQKQ